MYVSPWMQAALLPRRFDVCGFILPPLSLWHVYILRTSGNAYIFGDDCSRVDAYDVILYALGGVDYARKFTVSPNYRTRQLGRIEKRLRKVEFEKIHLAVSEYTGACMRLPSHKQMQSHCNKAVASKQVCAPIEWVLVDRICNGDATRIDEAWDSPYIKARCAFDAYRDVRGEVETLISESDEKRIDEKLERWAKEGAA